MTTPMNGTGSRRPGAAEPSDELVCVPSPRRVRGVIGGTTVVDSLAPALVWEPGCPVPGYVFPAADVREDLLRPAATPPAGPRHPYVRRWLDLHVDGRVLDALVFEYAAPGLEGYLAFDWFRRSSPGVEHWYEEDEEIFKHPRDPYKRVDALRSSRHVEVLVDGVKVADTTRPVLLFETGMRVRYYIPPAHVDLSRLRETDLSSTCPYKGDARYWSVVLGDVVHENIVWSYPTPIPAVANIAGLLAFYDELVDIVVDGEPLAGRPEAL